MNRIALIAALALAGTARMAVAQSDMGGTPGTTKTYERETNIPTSEQRQLKVVVKSVDKASHKVTFEATVSPEATVKKDGKPIKLDQLKPGDEVRASFDPKTGDVLKLEVHKMGSMQPSDMNQ